MAVGVLVTWQGRTVATVYMQTGLRVQKNSKLYHALLSA